MAEKIFAFAGTTACLISTLKPQCVCSAHDQAGSVTRRATVQRNSHLKSLEKKSSHGELNKKPSRGTCALTRREAFRTKNRTLYLARLKKKSPEDEQQATLQTQVTRTPSRLSPRLKGSYIGQPTLGGAVASERQEIRGDLNAVQQTIKGRRRHESMLLCALNELAWKSTTDRKPEVYEIGKQLYKAIYGNDLPADGLTGRLPPFPKPQHVRDELLTDLLTLMLAKDEAKRPTVRQCLGHDFWKFSREVRMPQGKGSVAEELKKEATQKDETTLKRNVETVNTQSTIKDESGRSSRKTSATVDTTRRMPQVYYHSVLPRIQLFRLHQRSKLLGMGTNWSVRKAKVGEKDVFIRCYELQGRSGDALWESICQKTRNCAAYGYIYDDCLYAVFDSQIDVTVNVRDNDFKFHTDIFAYFDVNGWEAGNSLVLQATDYHGKDCAVKVLEDNATDLEDIDVECLAMDKLRCVPEVPRLYGRTVRGQEGDPDRRHYIISEWVHGDPLDYTDNKHDHERCGRILHVLLQQIGAMHRLGCAHRDIKPANIMNQRDGNLRVIDFGEASLRFVEDIRGTLGFVAPEVLFKDDEAVVDAFAADVYSIGMTWHAIFFNDTFIPEEEHMNRSAYYRDLHSGSSDASALIEPVRKLKMPGAVPKLDAAMEDLFYGLTHPDPKKRISIDQALAHEYFKMRKNWKRESARN